MTPNLNARLLSLAVVAALQFGATNATAASAGRGSTGWPASTQSVVAPAAFVSPSIELTGYVDAPPGPNICASATAAESFSLTTLWTSSVPANSDSDLYELIVPGYGVVATYAEDNVGYVSPASNLASSYGVGSGEITVPYTVAANTTITHRMTTWANNSRSGTPSFVSEMDVNCTTGAILGFRNGAPQPPGVPVGGPLVSLLIAALLALTGFAIGRRRV